MRGIIRLAPIVTCLVGLAAGTACGFGQSSPSSAVSPSAHARTAGPSASPSAGVGAVWVIATVPVQLHSAPDLNSPRVGLLSWGEHVQAIGSQKAGSDSFLQVKADDGTEGWVVDRPDILTHRAVSKYLGTTFQILYPTGWRSSGDNPVTFASPASDKEGITLVAQTAGDTSQLPAAPLRPGQKLGDDAVQVGNPTYVLHSYKLDAGGFESFVSFKAGNTAYLFDFKQSQGSQPDTTLFKTLLGTVIVSG